MARKNVNTMTYEEAVCAFYDAAEKHADAGATDTEPRGVFADILEALARDSGDPRVDELIPRRHSGYGVNDRTWQLFDEHGGYFASRELTRQAERVVKVARRSDQRDVVAAYEYRYGRI